MVIRDNDSTLTTGTKVISSLAYNTPYYWRVRAIKCGGLSAWTSTNFTSIVAAPVAITLGTLAPSVVTGVSINPTLTWGTVAGAALYQAQVSTASIFDVIRDNDSTLTTGTKAISSLAYNTSYYWRVRAINNGGISAWTSTNFTSIVAAPVAVTLTAPINGVTGVSVNPSLTWGTVAGATLYQAQVSTASIFRCYPG